MVYLDMIKGIEESFDRIYRNIQLSGKNVQGKSDGNNWTTLEVIGSISRFPIAGYYKQEELKFMSIAFSKILRKKGIDFNKIEELESKNPDLLSKKSIIKDTVQKAIEEPKSRRGISVSTGCISLIQILDRDDSLNVFVYFRSSNLYILLYDLLMIYRGLYGSRPFRNRLKNNGKATITCFFGSVHLYLDGGPDFKF